MLVKTKNDNIWSNLYSNTASWRWRTQSNTPTKKRETTLTKDWKIRVRSAYYNMATNWWKLYFKVNWETIYSYEHQWSWKIEPFEYISPKLNAWDTFEVWIWSYWTSTTSGFYTPTYVDISDIIVEPFVKGYPQKIDSLWEFSTITLYGNHTLDNVFKWWIMLEKSNSANSWEITLPNAVWYIKVFFNGEYIKIPYYWD